MASGFASGHLSEASTAATPLPSTEASALVGQATDAIIFTTVDAAFKEINNATGDVLIFQGTFLLSVCLLSR
jgi:hypothetical protein